MGVLKGFGLEATGGGVAIPRGRGDGHLGLGAATWGNRLANIGVPGLLKRGGGDAPYGEGGRKLRGDRPRPPCPGGPDMTRSLVDATEG